MIHAIVGSSLKFRRLVVAAAAGIVILGISVLPGASVDALPEISPPYVEVQTEALGLSAEEVEQLITVPLEADLLNGVAWLDSIESQSVPGLSSIVLTFEPGTDPIRARQMVAERLTQAHALPNVSKAPVMLQPLSSSNRLMMIGLSSDELSLIDMSVLARWTIEPRLMGVPGVANVAIWGQRERQLQVLVDPERLSEAGVSLEDVVKTAGNALWVSPLTFLEASTPGTGGFLDTPNQRLSVQHLLPIDEAADLARVTLDVEGGSRLTLDDVASVIEDHQPLIGDALLENGGGLILVVEKFPGANTLEVTRGVEDAMTALGPAITGVHVDTTLFRPASYIEAVIDNVALTTLIGLLLVAVVLAALLHGWRAAIVTFVSIPLSIIAATVVLFAFGQTINPMVIAGFVVAIGVIVDDAIVGTSSIKYQLQRVGEDQSPLTKATAVARAVIRERGSTVYATLIVALAVGPLLLIGDATGAMIPSVVVAYLAAIVASMAISLTVAPALGMMVLRAGALERDESRLAGWLEGIYGAALNRLMDRARPAFAGVGVAAIAAVALFGISMAPALGQAGVPTFQDRDILIHWDGPPGTSHAAMSRIVGQVSDELSALPGVRSVGAHVGRAISSDHVANINAGEIWLSIAPDADYDATLATIDAVVAGYPGLGRDIVTYPAERVRTIVGGEQDDITVRVYGQDSAVMLGKAHEVQAMLAGIPGIVGATVDEPVVEPAVQITVDLGAAERHGLKAGDIRRASATLLSGIEVGSLFEAQKVFEVVVWGDPSIRRSVTDIENLQLETPGGDLIRLADVADIQIAAAPVSVERQGVQRIIDVGATVSGRAIGDVLNEVEQALAGLSFPIENHAEILGYTAERQAALTTMLAVGAAVIIATFLLLQAAFGSWRLAGLFFLTLPAALSGGVLVAVMMGGATTFGALLGLLAVLGVAVRGGLLLINHYQQLMREGAEFDRWLAVRGARERLGPTLGTAVATTALLLPFVIFGARAGAEIIQPIALVMLGGLLTSTLLNLFVVPSLFMRSGISPEAELAALAIEQAPEPQVIGAG